MPCWIASSSGKPAVFISFFHVVVGEAPHQFVIKAEVKARLAWIALPAGATTQLVIDAARFVTLGTQHKESVGIEYHLSVSIHHLGRFGKRLVPLRPAGGGEVNALPAQCLPGQALGIAAKQDVDTAARHIGSDCDSARADPPA